jgi:glycine cleavage system aminomethyltransferase T
VSDVQMMEVATPVAPTAEAVMRSPVHRQHVARGARFVRESGWDLPAGYAAIEAERQIIRDGLALADITARGKADLRGAIGDLRARVPLPVDSMFARLSSTWALVLTPPGTIETWIPAAEEAAGESTMVTNATSVYAGFVLIGSRFEALLNRLTAVDLSRIESGVAIGAQVAKIPSLIVRGDRAVEVYVGSEYGRYAWESLLTIGRPLGLEPVGWDALRAEKILPPPKLPSPEGDPYAALQGGPGEGGARKER